jgi:hypothetical protein
MTAISNSMLIAFIPLFFATIMAEADSGFRHYNNGGKITIAGYTEMPSERL